MDTVRGRMLTLRGLAPASPLALALAFPLLLAGCHARWNPLASPPRDPACSKSRKVDFAEPATGHLSSKGCEYAVPLKYTIPAAGTVTLSLSSTPPEHTVDLSIFQEDALPLATTHGAIGKQVIAKVAEGPLYVIVVEKWKDAIDLDFTVTAAFTPAEPAAP